MGKKSKKYTGGFKKEESERYKADANERLNDVISEYFASYDESSNNSTDREDAIQGPLKDVLKIIRMLEDHSDPIDLIFDHEHHLSSCDGDGAYVLISLFTMKHCPPGLPQWSAITSTVIRCHDNIRTGYFLPTQEQYSDSFFEDHIKTQRANVGHGFTTVPYSVCQKLVTDCLVRMKKSKKLLQGREEQTLVRLYALKTTSNPTKFDESQILPQPAPAPSVEALHLLLHQPEYFNFTMNEELRKLFGDDSLGKDFAKPETLQKAMRYISKDKYKRDRTYAMVKFQALWHSLRNEFDVSSWLLWELAAMMKGWSSSNSKTDEITGDDDVAIQSLENNVIFQLMINKFFNMGEQRLAPNFPNEGLYGRGISNYLIYSSSLAIRGSLPPGMLLTASIAQRQEEEEGTTTTGGSSSSSNNNNNNNIGDETAEIIQLAKGLKFERSNCAMCGATRSNSGGPLFRCSRCSTTVYCSKEHQKLHWKNGHKQECAKR